MAKLLKSTGEVIQNVDVSTLKKNAGLSTGLHRIRLRRQYNLSSKRRRTAQQSPTKSTSK